VEVKEQYRVEISNSFTALVNMDDKYGHQHVLGVC